MNGTTCFVSSPQRQQQPMTSSQHHPPVVAVYWDFISVYHDARGSMLSPEQQRLHERGLAAAALGGRCHQTTTQKKTSKLFCMFCHFPVNQMP